MGAPDAMYVDVIISGFGGQGILLIGNLLALAAIREGRNATYFPAYGPEMRGGAASCTVVVSDEDVGSPIVRRPRTLMALNRPSLDKFLPALADGGLLVVNSSLAPLTPDAASKTGRALQIPAGDLADSLGNPRMANMVMLGAWLAATNACSLPSAEACLEKIFPARNAHLVPANAGALRAGADAARAVA